MMEVDAFQVSRELWPKLKALLGHVWIATEKVAAVDFKIFLKSCRWSMYEYPNMVSKNKRGHPDVVRATG